MNVDKINSCKNKFPSSVKSLINANKVFHYVEYDIGIDSRNNKLSKAAMVKQDDFLRTLNGVLKLARCFGISAVGMTAAFIWTIVVFLTLLALEAVAIWKVIRAITGVAFNTAGGYSLIGRLSGSIFYGNALFSLMLSLRLISSWKVQSSQWVGEERNPGVYFAPDVHIRRRSLFVSWFVGVCAVVEHLLSMVSAIGLNCPPTEYFRKYILVSHGFLLQSYEYHLLFAIPIFIISKIATMLWNFQDLIIILISMGLTSRYNRMNLYLNRLVNIEIRAKFEEKQANRVYLSTLKWRRLREAYVRQAALVRSVDKNLGPLILLASLNNFYFICLQLFLGINKERGNTVNRIYHLFSLCWLMFRACSVVMSAADVNVHSKRALPLLFKCPSSAYNTEIKRLKNQLANDHIVLRGIGFFSMDRTLLLKVAAAIVKYELVLIQYDES